MPHKFRDLIVWQRAMEFVAQVYVLTTDYPKHELFGLTSQLRRAAISIPLNIAEGAGSDSSREFSRFLNIALKSAYETITAIEISVKLDYCNREQVEALLEEADQIAAMIVGLTKRLHNLSDSRTIRESIQNYSVDDDSDF